MHNVLFLSLVILISFINEALAQGAGVYSATTANISGNILTTAMCNIIRITTGNAGKAFAAFAIISVGIGFFTGKVSWGLMVGVAAGIAAMFGAPQIVAAISGVSAVDCK
jgi:type IV secretion system protein VirB2